MSEWDVVSEEDSGPSDPWAVVSEDSAQDTEQSPYDFTAAAIPESTEKPDANIARGMGERAADLAGNLMGSFDKFGEMIEENLPAMGGFAAVPGKPLSDEYAGYKYLNADEYEAFKQAQGSTKLLEEYGDDLKDTDFGYEQHEGWEQAKAVWDNDQSTVAQLAGAIGDAVSWGFETGAISMPDMVGAVVAPPAYLMSRTNEIAEERATADGREGDVSESDLGIAAVTALAVTISEKFGAEKLLGFAKEAGGSIVKGIVNGAWKGLVAEGSTEALQETIEYLGAQAGTEKGVTLMEGLERTLQGLVGGGSFGAPAGGVSGGISSFNDDDLAAAAAVNAGGESTGNPATQATDIMEGIPTAPINPDGSLTPVGGDITGVVDKRDPADYQDEFSGAAEAPVDMPTPEPLSELQLQMDELKNKKTKRLAVLVTAGAEKPKVSKGQVEHALADGTTLITNKRDKAKVDPLVAQLNAAIDTGADTNPMIDALLDTGTPEGKNPQATESVTTRDSDTGQVVSDVSLDPEGKALDSAIATAEVMDNDVEVRPVDEAIVERAAGVEAEQVGDLEAGLDEAPIGELPPIPTDLEAGLETDLEAGVGPEHVGIEFKEEELATPAVKEAIDAVNFSLNEFNANQQKAGVGRKATGSIEQRQTVDVAFAALVEKFEALDTEGYDTTALKKVLQAAAGNKRPTKALISDRNGSPVSGRIAAGNTDTNRAPPGGWGKVINDFYVGVNRELTKLAQEGPTQAPTAISAKKGTPVVQAAAQERAKTAKQAAAFERAEKAKAKKEKKASVATPKGQEKKASVAEKKKQRADKLIADGELLKKQVVNAGSKAKIDAKAATLDAAAHEAATSPKNDIPLPTEAQIEANDGEGNYKKGHYRWGGLPITIENPAGSKRKPEWPPLANHYGDWDGTLGADGDKIDGFFGTRENGKVFIVNQVNPDGKFDEHKTITGLADTVAEATQVYKNNYSKGFKVGPVIEATVDEFKAWLKDGDTTKPYAAPKASPTNAANVSKEDFVPSKTKAELADEAEASAPEDNVGESGSGAVETSDGAEQADITEDTTGELTPAEEAEGLTAEQAQEKFNTGKAESDPEGKKKKKYEDSILNSAEEEAAILMLNAQNKVMADARAAAQAEKVEAAVVKIREEQATAAAEQAAEIKDNAAKAAATKPVIVTKRKRRSINPDGIVKTSTDVTEDNKNLRRTPKIQALEQALATAETELKATKEAGVDKQTLLPVMRVRDAARKAVREAYSAQLIRMVDGDIAAIDGVKVGKYENTTLFDSDVMRGVDEEVYTEERDTAGQYVADVLDFFIEGTDATSLLTDIQSILPEGDPYLPVIEALQAKGVSDVLVSMTSAENVHEVSEAKPGVTVGGVFVNRKDGSREVYLNEDIMGAGDVRGLKTLIHELIHAVTSANLKTDNVLAKKMEHLRQVATYEFAKNNDIDYLNMYGMSNVDEFVAEALSNPAFQKALASIKVDPEFSTGVTNLWESLVNSLRNFLGLDVAANSVLSEVLALSPDLMMTKTELDARMKSMSPYVSDFAAAENASLDPEISEAEAQDMMRGDVVRRSEDGSGGPRNVLSSETLKAGAAKLQQALQGTAQLPRQEGNIGSTAGVIATVFNEGSDFVQEQYAFKNRFLLGWTTMDQIVRRYRGRFNTVAEVDGKEVAVNPLVNYWNVTRKKTQLARHAQQQAAVIDKLWREVEMAKGSAKNVKLLNTLMHDATMAGVHPELAFYNTANKHLWKRKGAQAQHTKLQADFNQMSPKARSVYRQVAAFYQTQRADFRNATLKQIAQANSLNKMLDGNNKPTLFNAVLKATTPADIDALIFPSDMDAKVEADIRTSLGSVVGATSVEGPYFPLRRFGDYSVEAVKISPPVPYTTRKEARAEANKLKIANPLNKVKTSKIDGIWNVLMTERFYEQFETKKEAKKRSAQMRAQGYTGRIGADGKPTEIGASVKEKAEITEGSGAHIIMQQVKGKGIDQGTEQYKALETAIITMMVENSLSKAQLKRNKVKGASTDMRRAFAERAFAGSWAVADVSTARDHAAAYKAMWTAARTHPDEDTRLSMGEVANEIKLRDQKALSEREHSKWDSGLAQAGFLWFLASPSYAVVNASQVPLVAMPYLAAKHGMTKTFEEMRVGGLDLAMLGAMELKNSRMGFKRGPENLLDTVMDHFGRDSDVGIMLQKLTDDGIIDATFMQELYESSQGKASGKGLVYAKDKMMDFARTSPQVIEIMNRVITAKSAYNLARQDGQSHADATESASEAVLETQFNYADENKPRYFKKLPGARAIMMFKMYSQGIYALMASNTIRSFKGASVAERVTARKTLAMLIASHTLAGGLLTGTLSEPLRALMGIWNALFEDDDEEIDWDTEIEMWLRDLLGDTAGAMAARGIPTALGIDLTGRVGLDNLAMMGMRDTTTAQEWYVEAIQGLIGPLAGLVGQGFSAYDYWSKGDTGKALESLMFKGGRDLTRGVWRYPQSGVTDMAGRELVGADELSAWDLAVQSFGFQPEQISEMYLRKSAVARKQKKVEAKRKELMHEWRNTDNKPEFYRTEIMPFNLRNDIKDRLLPKDLIKSVADARKKERELRHGSPTGRRYEREIIKGLGG